MRAVRQAIFAQMWRGLYCQHGVTLSCR